MSFSFTLPNAFFLLLRLIILVSVIYFSYWFGHPLFYGLVCFYFKGGSKFLFFVGPVMIGKNR